MIEFWRQLHNKSKNYYDPDYVSLPVAEWPASWKEIDYKTYPRFEQISLKKPVASNELQEIALRRRSERDFLDIPLTKQQLGDLLYYSAGEITTNEDKKHRVQPSAGGRYPIEVYAIVNDESEELRAGVYHYNVLDHTLEYLWPEKKEDKKPLAHDEWAQKASVMVVLTAVFWRSEIKYHDNGYRLMCLEAGSVLQNMCLHATAMDLKCTALRGTNDDVVESLLRLDTETESLIIAAAIGK